MQTQATTNGANRHTGSPMIYRKETHYYPYIYVKNVYIHISLVNRNLCIRCIYIQTHTHRESHKARVRELIPKHTYAGVLLGIYRGVYI